jgi:hypothetical protein
MKNPVICITSFSLPASFQAPSLITDWLQRSQFLLPRLHFLRIDHFCILERGLADGVLRLPYLVGVSM